MRALLFLLPGLLCGQTPGFPFYSSDSIANSAAGVAASYAPNTFITIYGNNLATVTKALGAEDVRDGVLPASLPGTFVSVYLNAQQANVYYVSAGQINLLVPTQFVPGPVTVQVVDSGRAGPAVKIMLEESAPGLFQVDAQWVIAIHADWTLVTEEAPARRGEIVILYATGLGPTVPLTPPGRLATGAARLAREDEFEVWLNGAPVGRERVLYAGVAPGYAGVYQINVRLPENVAENPEIRVGTPGRMSPVGRVVRLR
jgi:uncharacterized protein (TIGR03437 family)